ncbi:MAG: hypothetical protein P4L63_01215 [Candidatus Pacebacteria bacterium]|nr:hypothetical protein [Candidatus Paceibacterota bacterium]
MKFPEIFKRKEPGITGKEKPIAERYPSASPMMLEFLAFKEGRISLEELSNDALILVYKEKQKYYEYEAERYNVVRHPADFNGRARSEFIGSSAHNKTVKEQDDKTANARQELNKVLAVVRKRGLPEDQPDLKQDVY